MNLSNSLCGQKKKLDVFGFNSKWSKVILEIVEMILVLVWFRVYHRQTHVCVVQT
jgi:hypothetical protein